MHCSERNVQPARGFPNRVVGNLPRICVLSSHCHAMRRRSITKSGQFGRGINVCYRSRTTVWHLNLRLGTLLPGHRRMSEKSRFPPCTRDLFFAYCTCRVPIESRNINRCQNPTPRRIAQALCRRRRAGRNLALPAQFRRAGSRNVDWKNHALAFAAKVFGVDGVAKWQAETKLAALSVASNGVRPSVAGNRDYLYSDCRKIINAALS